MTTFEYWDADSGRWRSRPLPDYTRPVEGPPAPEYIVGMDLGQIGDPSALCVLEKCQHDPNAGKALPPAANLEPATYLVRHLRRWPLKTRYPDVARDVVDLWSRPPLGPTTPLVLDFGGVGPAFRDMLGEASFPGHLVPVTTSSGFEVGTPEPGRFTVPKRDMIMKAVILFQQRRLEIASRLSEARVLVGELNAFEARISARGRDTYNAKSGAHDDEVSALALACWFGERRKLEAWVV